MRLKIDRLLVDLKLKDENIEIKTGKKIYKKNGIVVDEMLTASIDIKRVQVPKSSVKSGSVKIVLSPIIIL
jgi:hypothetical protein